jgi:protein O-mannosyl-transferase
MNQGRESFTKGRGVLLLLLLAVIAVGWGVLDNGFVNYDDPQLLLLPGAAGRLKPTFGNLADWLFPSAGTAWLPLRFLLFSLLYTLTGPTAWIYHLASLLLYCVVCCQVYLLAHRLLAWDGYSTGSQPWKLERGNFWPMLGAAIFAACPLNVEALAWISAVKDLMYACCWLGFVLSIVGHDGFRLKGNNRALILLLLALAAKPAAIVLPLLAAGLIVMGPYRVRRDEIPWKIIGVALSVFLLFMIYLLPHVARMQIYAHPGGLGSTVVGALKVLFAYVGSFLVPVGLSVRYLVKVPLSVLEPVTMARAATLVVLCLAFWRMRSVGRYFPQVALMWCLLAFLPSSGVVPMEILRADRYALILIPMFAVGLVYGLREIVDSMNDSAARFSRILLWTVPLCFALLFVARVEVWSSSRALWSDVLADDSGHWIALNHLAFDNLERGDTVAAKAGYEAALAANPNSVQAINSLALLAEKRGELVHAEQLFYRAGRIREFDLKTSLELSGFLIRNDRLMEAARLLESQDEAGRESAEMHYLLSVVYRRLGYQQGAVERMNAARALEPGNTQYEAELGRLLVKQGELKEALVLLNRALEDDPSLVETYLGFGELFHEAGQAADAARSYYSALARDANNRDAMLGLAGLMGSAGRMDSAAVLLERLTVLYPSDCMVLANTVALRLSQGQFSQGAEILAKAIACDSSRVGNYLNGYAIYVALDSIGRAAVMLERAKKLEPSSPALDAPELDISARTKTPADTAIFYLSRFSSTSGRRVSGEQAPLLLDSLRNIPLN